MPRRAVPLDEFLQFACAMSLKYVCANEKKRNVLSSGAVLLFSSEACTEN